MQFAANVNIEKIRAELVCGLLVVDSVFFEFGEIFKIIDSGQMHIECDLPQDYIFSEHILRTLEFRLTKDFSLTTTPNSLIISWQPA